MKKGRPAAALLWEQAQKRQETHSTSVASMSPSNRLHSRVDESPDPARGAPRLRVIIPSANEPEEHDFSRLLVQPRLARLLAEGFRCWAAGVVRSTRRETRLKLLTTEEFLATFPPDSLEPDALDEAFWTAFLRWLNAPRDNGRPWSQTTRRKTLGVVRSFLDALAGHAQYGRTSKYLLDYSGMPKNPWPGHIAKTIPTSVLSPSEKDRVVVACLTELAELSQRERNRNLVLALGRERLTEERLLGLAPSYNDIGVCAALVEEAFPRQLSTFEDLRAFDPILCNAVRFRHRMAPLRRILYNTHRDLVPAVILIGILTAFNADTLLELNWRNIKYSNDGSTISFVGVKARAAGAQVSTHSADDSEGDADQLEVAAEPGIPDGLAGLLSLLRRLTERTREILYDVEHADRLFIGVPIISGSRAKAFEHVGGSSSDTAWKSALSSFIDVHDLPAFTLKMLRATEAEEEYRRTGDPLAVMRRLNHKSANTVRTHYTSDWMRRHGTDRIGEVQSLYVRWAESAGQVDPRHLPSYSQGAATPGFLCLDPFESPRPAQQSGRLCSAYGECPSCPLAAARPEDPHAAALYLALKRAIYAGQQGRISAPGWHAKWSGVVTDLDRLLTLIPSEVANRAAAYSVTLPAIG